VTSPMLGTGLAMFKSHFDGNGSTQWGGVNARSGPARADTNWTKRSFSLGQGSRPTSSSLAAPPLHHEPINANRRALSRRQHGRGNGRHCNSSFQFVSANIIRQRPYPSIIIVGTARLMNAMAICPYPVIFGRTDVTLLVASHSFTAAGARSISSGTL